MRAPSVALAGLAALFAWSAASAELGESKSQESSGGQQTSDGQETSAEPGAGSGEPPPWAAKLEPLLSDPATALREADRARQKGEPELAVALLSGVSERYPVIADYADRARSEVLLAEGRAEEAAMVASARLRLEPDSPLDSDLYELLGNARLALRDEGGARSAWADAIRSTTSSLRKARLHVATAESFERKDEPRKAAASYQIVWSSYPTTPSAKVATPRLEALELSLNTQRTGADWRKRADRLFRRRHNPEALAAYDRALEQGLTKSSQRRAQQQRAHTLFRMRRYPEAVEAFDALPKSDDTALWHARSLARSDRVMQSIAEFEDLAKRARSGAMRMRATFLAGLLLDGRGFEERANAHFDRVAHSSASSLSGGALWRLGWGAYRAGRFAEAEERLARLARVGDDSVSALRARYWRARALEQLGDERATGEFTAIAREYPFDYYGWRAAARAAPEKGSATPIEIPPGKQALSASQLERPRILIAAGLLDSAKAELSGLRRRARGVQDRIELAQLVADSGDFNEAQRVMMDAYASLLRRGPARGYEELWWYAWPAAYFEFVKQSTRSEGSVEPGLVLSIMREESGYRTEIISPVGARGLMQIMIPTGENLAAEVGLATFQPDDLFDPATNIRLGAHYLTSLSRRFDGRLSAAIASYNAGPEAVSSWGPSTPATDDEWVEAIPYDQTRSYVKRVLRSLRVYQVLY